MKAQFYFSPDDTDTAGTETTIAAQTNNSGLALSGSISVSPDGGTTDEASPKPNVPYDFVIRVVNSGNQKSDSFFVKFQFNPESENPNPDADLTFKQDEGLDASADVQAVVHFGSFPNQFSTYHLEACIYASSAPDTTINCTSYDITINTDGSNTTSAGNSNSTPGNNSAAGSTTTKESISYDVDGNIPEVAQPKSMACWATVATMNMSWKNKQSYSIESAMDSLGSDFRKLFNDNTGLAPDRIKDFSAATGMKVEFQKCETPGSILTMLQNYGPVIIIDDEDPSANFAVHARIIRGIHGDGNADTTFVKIIDPNGGRSYEESFKDFTSKYEAMADATGWNLQMMHY